MRHKYCVRVAFLGSDGVLGPHNYFVASRERAAQVASERPGSVERMAVGAAMDMHEVVAFVLSLIEGSDT